MKIQCSCGAKYVFDVVPGMQPVKFVCQSCGQDYSAFINELIRKETEQGSAPPPAPTTPPAPATSAAPAVPNAPETPRLRISRPQEASPAAQEQAATSKYCARHRTELTTASCQVCGKPICPQCLDTFGPFCSPFCRNKVQGASMNAPVHTGRKFAAERKYWRKAGLISGVAGAVAFCALAFWIWYAWIGSMPHPVFTVRWDDISHSGSSWIVGNDQIVFLHGGTLARYDLKTKQKVWSLDLITQQQVADAVRQAQKDGAIGVPRLIQKDARIGLEQDLSLMGSGKNIWIAQGNTLTHYDWNTGNVLQTVTLTNNIEGQLIGKGDDFMGIGHTDSGVPVVTRISMTDGQVQIEHDTMPGATAVAENATTRRAAPANGGLPISPYGQDRPMNPQRVAQQVQNMSLPGRLALPALLANSEHQRQIAQELRSEDQSSRPRPAPQATRAQQQQMADESDVNLVPDGNTYLAFYSKMTKENLVSREAMKAPPKHSALDNPNLSSANESAAVNEQLNDIQRMHGGDKVTEDESTYQVAIRRLDSPTPDWTGNVTGPPQFFALKTVNVVAAGKTVMAFDKSNKKLWQSELSYPITGGDIQAGEQAQSEYGQGPCVEHEGTLYVFDQAVLTAFDASSGNVRWRIPSVGVVGLFFGDKGMLYVNTTTGNPDDIRYSREIDVDKQTAAVVLKVDPSNGTILWKATPGGYISYLSGDFIYADQYYDAGDTEDELSDAAAGLQKPAYFRIMRINPANGRIMWEYNEGRAPVDIEFDNNIISVVLKKEVEVLRFFTL